ncbi:tumor necrosis factor receptor superfamily member 6B-like isoform X2 [Toxotes jaculatrix]|uniref:tumor necrosis factor receptor superfamily member 6B-like isoform X2 n=1 Tax=Toxotes jaculatrix TaxID=941984 RepID=UPI001B3AA480|nr:tumor necrosis factor receptor superfamily member 6B-like isoform X2 [Toxotes jaculatrix]
MTMMLVPFLVLMSLRMALVDGVGAPVLTYRETDPTTGKQVECERCPPGTYLRSRCTSTLKSECAPCPTGSFTELWNHIGKCLRCGVCGQNQVVKTACTANSDCQCECKRGFYYKRKYDLCVRHSECPSGQGLLTAGTADEDTVCHICPNGTFSDTVSAHHNCTEHQSCYAVGLQLLLRGSTWHNSVCMADDGLASRDGAIYLKEILPAFFLHQKTSIRRLRRIVHNLPSEDGKKQGGTSQLNLSELNVRLNAWVASATPKQIREFPAILMKIGANGAGERLRNKLQRIDSKLMELSALGNEVHSVLMPE